MRPSWNILSWQLRPEAPSWRELLVVTGVWALAVGGYAAMAHELTGIWSAAAILFGLALQTAALGASRRLGLTTAGEGIRPLWSTLAGGTAIASVLVLTWHAGVRYTWLPMITGFGAATLVNGVLVQFPALRKPEPTIPAIDPERSRPHEALRPLQHRRRRHLPGLTLSRSACSSSFTGPVNEPAGRES
jgi:hypothetical protein